MKAWWFLGVGEHETSELVRRNLGTEADDVASEAGGTDLGAVYLDEGVVR